jgi:transcriptional regulator with XRE-family HTH domain
MKLSHKDAKKWRKALGLSQAVFYGAIGLGQDRGSRYERGENAWPTEVEMALVAHWGIPDFQALLAEARKAARRTFAKSRLQVPMEGA